MSADHGQLEKLALRLLRKQPKALEPRELMVLEGIN